MTQRTRYFLIVSALITAVGLGTGLVAYYSGGMAGGSAAISELAYVPVDAKALAYADVRSIMNSELRQRLREMLPTGEDKDRLLAEIGLDIERDIDTVLAGYTGSATAEGGLVLVRGRFDDDMIETKAVQHGAVAETYRDKRMIVAPASVSVPEAAPGGDAVREHVGSLVPGIAFLEPGLIAFGDAATLRRAIDAAATKTDVTGNVELMKFVNDMQGTGNAWMVSRFDAVSENANLPGEIKDHLPALQWIAGSAHVNGGLTGTLRAETRDEKGATDLQAVVTGGLAAARMMSGQDPRLEAVLNSVQVMGSGKSVSVTFALHPELFDMLSGLTGMNRPGLPPGQLR